MSWSGQLGMSDQPVYDEQNAALIEVHQQVCALTLRYRHAAEKLLDEGRFRDWCIERQRALDSLCDSLQSRIKQRDLLPHDINIDREDLARLADRFREWLDQEGHGRLKQALMEREEDLLKTFERLATTDRAAVQSALEATRAAIDKLS